MQTGYAIAKSLNAQLAELDLKPVQPQMLYNYISKGLIPSTDKRVTDTDAERFIATQLERRIAKAAKAAEQLEAELTAS